jgi:hypothetical protein
VKRVAYPTQDQIDQLHYAYVDELKELFEKHKVNYNVHEDIHLVLDEV